MDDQTAGFDIGNVETRIEIDPDGGVTISVPTKPADKPRKKGFNENLALREDIHLATLANELLEGIELDKKSRSGFVENYTKGLSLLGLNIKEGGREKTSQVGHPLLLESVIRAQSSAGGELMPPSGPCKCTTPGGSDQNLDLRARAFETDMNAYLTTVASEYYPDLDRGLFGLFYGGNLFRKVYNHPLRRRPVAETVDIADMIVSEDATDLETAIRATHRSEMTPSMVRRMQRFADWREVDLGNSIRSMDPMRLALMEVDGINDRMARPQDVPHEILEVTCDLDLAEYGFEDTSLPDLPLPYVVTIDQHSREVLALRRGWIENDELFRRKQRFVHYGMIPSFRFLNLGFVHLLGNQTQVLRGIWRALVTQGMLSNHPGGVKAKGVRTGTNELNPSPGEWIDIDLGPVDDIRKALFPMPYKDVSAPFLQLAEQIGEDAQRMAGVMEQLVGTGLTNVPVGTMMSAVEIATQPMSAIHKRLHRAQAKELQLLKECFAENPAALAAIPNVQHPWSRAEEFADMTLVPSSDPNVPSQIHRIQLATALITVSSQNPMIYDQVAVHKRAWSIIGVQDVDSLVVQQPAPPQPPGPQQDPMVGQAKMLEAQVKMKQLEQTQTDMQRKAAIDQINAQTKQAELAQEAQMQRENLSAQREKHASDRQIEQMRMQIEQQRAQAEDHRESQRMAHEQSMAQQQHAMNQQAQAHDQNMAQQDHQMRQQESAQNQQFAREQHEDSMAAQQADRESQAETARYATDTQAKTAVTTAKLKPAPAKGAGAKPKKT